MLKRFIMLILMVLIFAVTARAGDYVIGEGDVLHISEWGVPELNLTQRVRPDGKITIPALGELTASGHTPVELQKILTEKLQNLVKKPVVTVIVDEINNNRVYVFGGGVRPGIYSLTKKTSLLQLLCQIAEFTDADLRNAYVMRKKRVVKRNFYNLFTQGNTDEDILLEPDDIVFIPAFTEKNVYVLGAVNTPKIIKYRDGITIMEAILDAGGFNKFAKENDVIIYRNEKGKEIKIKVKLKDLMKEGDLSQNVRLHPGDYIVVKEGIF